jgi:hypothetical protein
MMTVFRAALVVSAALFFGCGGDAAVGQPTPNASYCDYRAVGAATAYCQEYQGDAATLAAYKSACAMNGGAWADVGCPRETAVGGCRTTSTGLTLTNWFYSGGPYSGVSAVMSICYQDGKSTYVAP